MDAILNRGQQNNRGMVQMRYLPYTALKTGIEFESYYNFSLDEAT